MGWYGTRYTLYGRGRNTRSTSLPTFLVSETSGWLTQTCEWEGEQPRICTRSIGDTLTQMGGRLKDDTTSPLVHSILSITLVSFTNYSRHNKNNHRKSLRRNKKQYECNVSIGVFLYEKVRLQSLSVQIFNTCRTTVLFRDTRGLPYKDFVSYEF